jgi:hypothetical protein
MMTVQDAAIALGVSKRQAHRWVSDTDDTREFHRERVRIPRPTVNPAVNRMVLVTLVDLYGLSTYADLQRVGRPRSGK